MKDFYTTIQTEIGTRDFKFIRVFTANGVIFYVTTLDERKRALMFTMTIKNGEWKFNDYTAIQPWLQNIETKLAMLIAESNPL